MPQESKPGRSADPRLQIVLDAAPDALITVGSRGNIIAANQRAERLFGYARDELAGVSIEALVPERFRSAHVAQRVRFLSVDNPVPRTIGREVAALRKDGSEFSAEITLGYSTADGDSLTVASIRDVSDRKRADKALRESEERYRTLFDNLIEGFAHCRMEYEKGRPVDFTYLDVNAAFETLTGLKNVVGRRASEVIPGIRESDATLIETYGRVATTGTPERFETFVQALGIWFDISVYSPKPEHFVAVFDVITERKKAESGLKQARDDLRQIIDHAVDGISIRRGKEIIYVNPAMASMLGIDAPQRMIGGDLMAGVIPEDRELMARRLDGAVGQPVEIRARKQDGSIAILECSPGATIEFEGAPALVTVARDVTERNRLKTQLMISDRMASVGILAAGVAHEINNPLAVAMANVELAARTVNKLAAESPADPRLSELKEMLRDALDGTDRVKRIVKDLKIFSRAEEDKLGAVDVERVIESSLRMAWNEIKHRTRVEKSFGRVPPVEANESRLAQVFLNLIVNAAQSMQEGRADDNKIVVTTSTDSRGRVIVEVKDTGAGISPDVLGKLFTPFFTTKPIGVGTGLGLTICQRIVSDIGGEIGVESRVGEGTVFRVALLASRKELSPSSLPPAVPAARHRGRVLVIDDAPAIGAVVKRALQGEHEVVTVTNADDALEQISAGARFDVILCDLMMPIVTGQEFYGRLADIAPEQVGRVVFLTGGAFTPGARSFLDDVPAEHIEKPFRAEVLRALVNKRTAAR